MPTELDTFRQFFTKAGVVFTEDDNFVDDEQYQASRPAWDRDANTFLEVPGSRFYFDKNGRFMGVGSDETDTFEKRSA